MDQLPEEILLYITTFLSPAQIIPLHLVSKRLHRLTRDNELWRNICFNRSSFGTALHYYQHGGYRSIHRTNSRAGIQWQSHARALFQRLNEIAQSSTTNSGSLGQTEHGRLEADGKSLPNAAAAQRAWSLANWDPSYPHERVDWYGEYIARHAPLSISWLQAPGKASYVTGEASDAQGAKGIGYYTGSRGSRVVAPLGDGSVCLWDLTHNDSSAEPSKSHRGAVFARSKSGLLWGNGADGNSGQYADRFAGTVECVSIDNIRNKAYFAIQNKLNEVDLETLQISSCEPYDSPISALSRVDYPVPLTVGTTGRLYLHDPRRAKNAQSSTLDGGDRVENFATYPAPPQSISRLLTLPGDPPPSGYAPLYQPGPLSILHLASNGSQDPSDGEIYVGGRFPSILVYDRRCFPKLQNTIYSGARLCSLASIPYSFNSLGTDLTQKRQLSSTQVLDLKSQPGNALVACGEYNGKGSLEIYGLSSLSKARVSSFQSAQSPLNPNPVFKNRVNASRSKLLSVATQGTRLVASDSDGNIQWMERDGCTLVRSWNINQRDTYPPGGIFSFLAEEMEGEIGRKVLPTNENVISGRVAQDELLVWTGHAIGLLGFKPNPAFGINGWEARAECIEERMRTREERMYQQTMRRVLEKQADEVRFLPGLGLGSR